ncbi:hypothetical protein CGI92_23190 [Vibrio parahaemolyticus]|nr:hypothetical protein CGI92_23190 [Vibrio parahaemolyticus]
MYDHLDTKTGDIMTKRERRTFNPEFKLECAQLVLDQEWTYKETCEAMGIGRTTLESWVRQLKAERVGKAPSASPLTPEQREIRDLKKKIKRIKEEKEILKKATAYVDSPLSTIKANNDVNAYLCASS